MIIECVKGVNTWINTLLAQDGVSKNISPRTIVSGITTTYGQYMITLFSTYSHVHCEGDNSMRPRTTAAIALRPMGNLQGGFHFLSLRTGRVITAREWTNLPMSDDVVNRVNEMGKGGSREDDVQFRRRKDTVIFNNKTKTTKCADGVGTHWRGRR